MDLIIDKIKIKLKQEYINALIKSLSKNTPESELKWLQIKLDKLEKFEKVFKNRLKN